MQNPLFMHAVRWAEGKALRTVEAIRWAVKLETAAKAAPCICDPFMWPEGVEHNSLQISNVMNQVLRFVTYYMFYRVEFHILNYEPSNKGKRWRELNKLKSHGNALLQILTASQTKWQVRYRSLVQLLQGLKSSDWMRMEMSWTMYTSPGMLPLFRSLIRRWCTQRLC